LSRTITLTDPTWTEPAHLSALDRLGLSLLVDPRDLVFWKLTVQASAVLIPFAVALYVPGVFTWWLGVLYVAVLFGAFFDRYILMLHNTSHRRLFDKRVGVLNHYIPWVLGPLMGETPETYYAHHIGMHHPENNLPDDLSTTMPFQRDSFAHFLRYWGRFFFLGLIDLARYMAKRKRRTLERRLIVGELSFYALVVGLSFVNLPATFVVFIFPFAMARFLMMAGNWGQHAFIDAADPGNSYKNSLTCINSRYNRRCFNDGYHIGHHVKATRHWSELPSDFLADRANYVRNDSIVFEGIDFFMVWAALMLKRYRWLARHFVELRDTPRTEDEIIALLRERTRPIAA
jgi:hypothetical protein